MQISMAPAEATGQEAFRRAEASSRLRDADALEEAEGLVAGMTASAGAGRGGNGTVRHVGRKLFVLNDGIWTDMTFVDSLQVIEVAPFSDAYFELAERLPALTPYLALGEQVIIAGDGVALAVTPDGVTVWKAAELRVVLRGFERGL